MLIGHTLSRVSVELADAGDIPSCSEVIVSVEAAGIVSDGDGDSKFFSSSSSSAMRLLQALTSSIHASLPAMPLLSSGSACF